MKKTPPKDQRVLRRKKKKEGKPECRNIHHAELEISSVKNKTALYVNVNFVTIENIAM